MSSLRSTLLAALLIVTSLALPLEAIAGQLTLTWQDNSNNESNFDIQRCLGTGCTTFSSLASVGANITTYVDTAVVEGSTYCYRVDASNSGGVSAFSNTACGTVAFTIPAAPSNLTVR
jgi:hypothetical protein